MQFDQHLGGVLVLLDGRPIGGDLGRVRDRIFYAHRRQHVLNQEQRRDQGAVGHGQASRDGEAVLPDIVLQRLQTTDHLSAQQGDHGGVAGRLPRLAAEHEHVVHQVDVGDPRDRADLGGLARGRAQHRGLRIEFFQIFRDHLGLRNDVAAQVQHRDPGQGRGLVELAGQKSGRQFDVDVGNGLGVDLHPHLGGIGA